MRSTLDTPAGGVTAFPFAPTMGCQSSFFQPIDKTEKKATPGGVETAKEVLKDQGTLIRKVNRYNLYRNLDGLSDTLTGKPPTVDRKLLPAEGVCHGLTLFWLKQMILGKVENFYGLVDKIAAHDVENDPSINISFDIYSGLVIRSHDPEKYFPGASWKKPETIKHLDLPVSSIEKKEFSMNDLYSKLNDLTKNDEEGVCISSVIEGKAHHSIGMYRKGSTYYLYDSNFKNGRAKEYNCLYDLMLGIKHCLYDNFNIKAPTNWKLWLFGISPAKKIENGSLFAASSASAKMEVDSPKSTDDSRGPTAMDLSP
jgi:hypothetical protein